MLALGIGFISLEVSKLEPMISFYRDTLKLKVIKVDRRLKEVQIDLGSSVIEFVETGTVGRAIASTYLLVETLTQSFRAYAMRV